MCSRRTSTSIAPISVRSWDSFAGACGTFDGVFYDYRFEVDLDEYDDDEKDEAMDEALSEAELPSLEKLWVLTRS